MSHVRHAHRAASSSSARRHPSKGSVGESGDGWSVGQQGPDSCVDNAEERKANASVTADEHGSVPLEPTANRSPDVDEARPLSKFKRSSTDQLADSASKRARHRRMPGHVSRLHGGGS